ncbi:carboxymuconolactone decarboxylase family protein [Mycolicibacterium porcinum]|uniref:carboxymuconolactone decarboxylase family protein n=1 Tax=Mycolicibacterium porcinum TaxID=39693 RepID=UPI0031F971DF
MTSQHHSESAPRITPLPIAEWDEEATAAVASAFGTAGVKAFRRAGAAPNVLATMVHYPGLAAAFNRLGNVLLSKPAIGHRERELMLLRVAWRTGAQYEWVHHVLQAEHYGLDELDIQGVIDGGCATWSPLEADLVAAADQLLDRYRIDDATWQRLAGHLDSRQLVELPFIVGTYTCLAMAFNSWNLQVEDGLDASGVPPLPR